MARVYKIARWGSIEARSPRTRKTDLALVSFGIICLTMAGGKMIRCGAMAS